MQDVPVLSRPVPPAPGYDLHDSARPEKYRKPASPFSEGEAGRKRVG